MCRPTELSNTTSERYPLLNCLPERLADTVVAYQRGKAIKAPEFLHHVRSVAAALSSHATGKHCLNVCQDRYQITVLLAAVMLAKQISLLPPNTAELTLNSLCKEFDGTFVVCDQAHRTQFEMAGQPYSKGTLSFEQLCEQGQSLLSQEQSVDNMSFDAEQCIGILFTSGSTGAPTPNPRSWGALCESARAEAHALELFTLVSSQDPAAKPTVVGTVPAQHSYGIESTVAMCLQNSFAIASDASFFPADILAALANVPRPRVLVTTPYHLKLLLDAIDEAPADEAPAPVIDVVVSATAPLSPQLAAKAEKQLGCPIREIFGSTESGQIAARRTTQTDLWTLFPNTFLASKENQTWASGGHVAGEKLLNDIVEILPNHQFKLLGRTSDMVNMAGKRTSLGNLNFHLNSIDGVLDGVFFLPESDDGALITRLQAVVVSSTLNSSQIIAALRKKIDPIFLPRKIRLVARIPRNSTGKVTQAILASLQEEDI
jgi:acyl-coenzyme A synthetase/AMP-(fatty) acid ligase